MEMTVHRGVRWSAANAFLWPAVSKGRIDLVARALARRILLDGRKAIGVEYEQGGETRQVFARREVVVSASTINSPPSCSALVSGLPPTLKRPASRSCTIWRVLVRTCRTISKSISS